METVAAKEEIYNYTSKKLRAHFQNDEEFNTQFSLMLDYYKSKFQGFLKEEDQEIFERKFYQSVKSQFFNGYFIIRELLSDKDTVLPDEWLVQPEGHLTEDIPELIKELSGSNVEEVVTTEEMHDLTMWIVTRYEDVLYNLKQTAFEIACLGAKQAVVDERDIRGLEITKSSLRGRIGSLDDITFINPQIYLVPNVSGNESEIWTLNWWSSLSKEDNKAGEVTIITIPAEGEAKYRLNVYASNAVAPHEREQLLHTLLFLFMETNNIAREHISLHFAVVENFYILVQE